MAMEYVLLVMAAAALVSGEGQICPDGSRCSDGSCCPTNNANQQYGCCPFLNAVCCPDRLHCCPKNYHCDMVHSMCLPNWTGGPAVRLEGARSSVRVADTCPDKKTTCSPQATCCKLASSGYACCPEPHAVCCQDHIHCCPQGTKCDVKERTCLKENRHTILNLL